ncbi:unnamed protein product [Kuraishia capsulata CBS 1993]|uniref:Large ribosomal subunit protein mL49 n=1 Tax=Kuraishia capsulata CBS 1993 TaxID=1382522 RepID=W6MLN2_9ASCO|nr:uncharacterized protein KUCA_T00001732001 [Kuraishia capsulata CBS 1993]CDK25762.1 unnamed protein product [Kuraishia capsulata CBS 1993]
MFSRFRILARQNSTASEAAVSSVTKAQAKPFASKSYIFPALEEIKAEELVGKPFGPKSHAYFISRTKKGQLPVYRTYRRKVAYTEIRRVEGDIVQLRNDIQAAFPDIQKKDFNVVMQSLRIMIRGDHLVRITDLFGKKF